MTIEQAEKVVDAKVNHMRVDGELKTLKYELQKKREETTTWAIWEVIDATTSKIDELLEKNRKDYIKALAEIN